MISKAGEIVQTSSQIPLAHCLLQGEEEQQMIQGSHGLCYANTTTNQRLRYDKPTTSQRTTYDQQTKKSK